MTYHHVELLQHDVILAEGLPCESYLNVGDRANFADSGDVIRLYPDFSTQPRDASGVREAYGYAPLIIHGLELEVVQSLVNTQAAPVGTASVAA